MLVLLLTKTELFVILIGACFIINKNWIICNFDWCLFYYQQKLNYFKFWLVLVLLLPQKTELFVILIGACFIFYNSDIFRMMKRIPQFVWILRAMRRQYILLITGNHSLSSTIPLFVLSIRVIQNRLKRNTLITMFSRVNQRYPSSTNNDPYAVLRRTAATFCPFLIKLRQFKWSMTTSRVQRLDGFCFTGRRLGEYP